MSHKLLVVTFQPDLPQFRVFCHCLHRNWQGDKSLIVVVGSNTDRTTVEQIVALTFDHTWQVEIKDTVQTTLGGDIEQELNKIVYSINSDTDDVIVFDSKDFLLRPCNFTTFKQDDRYRVTYKLAGKYLVDMGYNIKDIVDQPVDHLPAVSNLTPWIWNIDQLSKFWQHLNQRFGPYLQWTAFPAGNEIYGYYVYTWTRPDRPIKWLTHPDMPLLIAGGWTHQTYEGMLQESKNFDLDPCRVVWKHSRKITDARCWKITQQQLVKHGINLDFEPT